MDSAIEIVSDDFWITLFGIQNLETKRSMCGRCLAASLLRPTRWLGSQTAIVPPYHPRHAANLHLHSGVKRWTRFSIVLFSSSQPVHQEQKRFAGTKESAVPFPPPFLNLIRGSTANYHSKTLLIIGSRTFADQPNSQGPKMEILAKWRSMRLTLKFNVSVVWSTGRHQTIWIKASPIVESEVELSKMEFVVCEIGIFMPIYRPLVTVDHLLRSSLSTRFIRSPNFGPLSELSARRIGTANLAVIWRTLKLNSYEFRTLYRELGRWWFIKFNKLSLEADWYGWNRNTAIW